MSSTPSSSPALSQSSTKFGQESSVGLDDSKTLRRRAVERVKHAAISQDVLLFLIAFRILNALSIKTFFQPDEFFQSLEPAWALAFGADSGAWITWVCTRCKQLFACLGTKCCAGVEEPAAGLNTPCIVRRRLLDCFFGV